MPFSIDFQALQDTPGKFWSSSESAQRFRAGECVLEKRWSMKHHQHNSRCSLGHTSGYCIKHNGVHSHHHSCAWEIVDPSHGEARQRGQRVWKGPGDLPMEPWLPDIASWHQHYSPETGDIWLGAVWCNHKYICLELARATFAESFAVAKEPFAGPILSIGPPFGEVGTNLWGRRWCNPHRAFREWSQGDAVSDAANHVFSLNSREHIVYIHFF